MGRLSQLLDNPTKGYIQFYEFIDLLQVFLSDDEYAITRFLIGERDFLELNYYSIEIDIVSHKADINLYKPKENSTDTHSYSFLYDYLQQRNDNTTFDKYWCFHWKVSELLDLNIFKNIGLSESIFSHCEKYAYADREWKPNKAIDYAKLIDTKNIIIHDLQEQIAELNAQKNHLQRQADEPSDTPADSGKTSRSQDDKLIVAMALLLAEKCKIFERANKPNANQIGIAVSSIADFMIDKEDKYGLTTPAQRIRTALKNTAELIKKS